MTTARLAVASLALAGFGLTAATDNAGFSIVGLGLLFALACVDGGGRR